MSIHAPISRSKVRILIVDDQPSMRRLIRFSLENDPEIEVVAEAGNARSARDAVNKYRPDVVTLDVEMPEINGLEFLQKLMKARPTPVVMISTLTERGSEAAVQALALGAIECLPKPKGQGGQVKLIPRLAQTIKMAARAHVRSNSSAQVKKRSFKFSEWNGKVILIGASTGGVDAIETLLESFPANCPPTLITQHMPEQFLKNFASRLNAKFGPRIMLATEGKKIEQGEILIAPGGANHLVFSPEGRHQVALFEGPKRSGHRPSVDEMMLSAKQYAKNCVGAILTGMGYDGAEGMAALRSEGAYCIAQDDQTSVVYGMPRVANEKGGADVVLPLGDIAPALLARCGKYQIDVSGA
jgi:two-component system chemotaxis response regulator CheB